MPKSIWSFAKLVARALSTVQGATALFLVVLGALRLERMITLIIGDYPALVAFLQPWVNQAMWLAAGIMIYRATYDQLRLSHIPDLMPARELVDPASKQGWDFETETSLDLLDLANVMQQSALDGVITVWGRSGQRQIEEIWGPLEKIPADHWRTFEVWPMAFMSDNNADMESRDIRRGQDGYFDLHVDREPALWWLKHVACKERGKRAELEAKRDAKIAECRKLREQERAERERDIPPPPTGPNSWMA